MYAAHSRQFIPQGAMSAVWSRHPAGASVGVLFRFVAMGRTWQIPGHFSTAVERWLNEALHDFKRRSATLYRLDCPNRGMNPLKAAASKWRLSAESRYAKRTPHPEFRKSARHRVVGTAKKIIVMPKKLVNLIVV
jgi:hypothetical protein